MCGRLYNKYIQSNVVMWSFFRLFDVRDISRKFDKVILTSRRFDKVNPFITYYVIWLEINTSISDISGFALKAVSRFWWECMGRKRCIRQRPKILVWILGFHIQYRRCDVIYEFKMYYCFYIWAVNKEIFMPKRIT